MREIPAQPASAKRAEPVLRRPPPVAILIVNGGADPEGASWLEICLRALRAHTAAPEHHLYIWNNNLGARRPACLASLPSNATLLEADPSEELVHPHAVPMERLRQRAERDGTRFFVTLDTDAFPIRDDWLIELVGALENGAVLAGVWHAESEIPPYIHPCCLASSHAFMSAHGLRLDGFPKGTGRNFDVAGHLSFTAQDAGLPIHRLSLSNHNRLHHVIGSMYGDAVYHHGAGSRGSTAWWTGQRRDAETFRRNAEIRDLLACMLVRHPGEYLSFLRGEAKRAELSGILGMHESGFELQEALVARARSLEAEPEGFHALLLRWAELSDRP